MYIHLRDHHRWVLPEVLAFQARRRPDALYIETTEGDRLTYGGADADSHRVAGALFALGVRPGDRVAVMLPNTLDFVRIWLGVGRLGAVLVPLNTGLSGAFLEHPLKNSGARVIVANKAFRVLVEDARQAGQTIIDPDELTNAEHPWDGPLPRAADTPCILYTPGTTAPSKGALMPHAHCYLFGLGTIDSQQITADDRYYVVLPLFHVNGLFMQLYAVMIAGASAVLRAKFSAGAFVDDLHRYGITVTSLLGAAAAFVIAQPPSFRDRGHKLRIIQAAPNPTEHARQWKERFGVGEVLSGFGMTEVNIPVYGRIGATRPNTSGLVYDRYFEVEIRDPDTDDPVPDGVIGEIMVRPKAPFGFMAGYHGMPEATVAAWRNFWFHTGDAGVRDADGYVTFVDRIKDCIRRRGENISSFEVEAAMKRLDGVLEVAAFAVPSEIAGAEDEVMLAVVPQAGCGLTVAEIAAHAAAALPRFAQPRFIELMSELPKTPTEKIRKQVLRRRGVSPATVDLTKTLEGVR
jgi:crotonobetaine/carnitine-CoA ligase